MHVPYKGTGQALTDLLGGQIELMFAPTQTVMPQLQAGQLQGAIAVTGTRAARSRCPSLPTVASAGLPGYQAQGWFGLLAPKATPPAVIAKIHDDVDKVLAMPDVRKDLISKGAQPGSGSSAEFGALHPRRAGEVGQAGQGRGHRPRVSRAGPAVQSASIFEVLTTSAQRARSLAVMSPSAFGSM